MDFEAKDTSSSTNHAVFDNDLRILRIMITMW